MSRVGLFVLYSVSTLLTLWAVSVLYIDIPDPHIPLLYPIVYLMLIVYVLISARSHFQRFILFVTGFTLVLLWWFSLKPSNDRPWQADVRETPWVDIREETISIHNFRSCDYHTEFDYECSWLTKTVNLGQLRGIDVAITYWGSPNIAHPILSFQFGDNDYVAASIETRKEMGEGYSAINGFFRHYELVYVLGDERDLIRLRTNYRTGEDVYLFHTTATPEWSRKLFLEYMQRANSLHEHPEWYNALTRNCTTAIFSSMASIGQLPGGTSRHDWRILLNGRGDEMLYENGHLAGGLPFPELKESAHINAAARQADQRVDFSRQIRIGRPGFESETARAE